MSRILDTRPRLFPLVLRAVAGAVYVGFSLGKFTRHRHEADAFDRDGLPFPDAFTYAIGTLELVGGALLIVGLLVRPVALALAGNMVGAISTAGVQDGGPVNLGLAPALLVTMLVLVWAGAGRLSVDARLTRRR
jgi:putative oxidoreductase